MRTILYLATALCVMGLAFWAYHVNYATQDRLNELDDLKQEIASLQEGLDVLNAEWAYENRPDRLRELVNLNFSSLGLLPFAPEQFGTVGAIAYPDPESVEAEPASPDTLAGMQPEEMTANKSTPLEDGPARLEKAP